MPFSGGDSAGGGEQINHFGAIKLRVTGSGTLRPKLYGLDGTQTITMATLTLATAPGLSKTILVNFVNQRARLELKTTAIDEIFKINRIIVYVKPLYTSVPA